MTAKAEAEPISHGRTNQGCHSHCCKTKRRENQDRTQTAGFCRGTTDQGSHLRLPILQANRVFEVKRDEVEFAKF